MQVDAICIGDAARSSLREFAKARRLFHVRHCRTSIFLAVDEAVLADNMQRAQDGDRGAYNFVLEHCRDALSRLARERRPAGSCEIEIVHECLLTLHRARHTFDPKTSLSAWVGGIARHHRIGRLHRPAMHPMAHIRGLFKDLMTIAGYQSVEAAMATIDASSAVCDRKDQ